MNRMLRRHLTGHAVLNYSVTPQSVRHTKPWQITTQTCNRPDDPTRRRVSSYSGSSQLHHIHLKGDSPSGFTIYETAEELQEDFRSAVLAWKSNPHRRQDQDAADPPKPRLISFESTPTFTLGRRQHDITATQKTRMQEALTVSLAHRESPVQNESFVPTVIKTNRGGLTTYHGPGQLVLWPVLDMHSPLYPKFNVSSYANLLEVTTQRLLEAEFGIKTYTTHDEPGVWVEASGSKIAALGVHHRRYVTALGTAINMDIPVTGSEAVNPWARFVPCGLEGKSVTSVEAERGSLGGELRTYDMEYLARTWAQLFEAGLFDAEKRGLDSRR